MENKHQVHNLIILDESGSMSSIKDLIISGFNEMVQTIKGIEQQQPDQEHYISFVSFNGLGKKVIHFVDPAQKLEKIDDENYQPDANTPLYDAIAFAVNKLKYVLQEKTNYNVLVTIMTDGEENASQEYSSHTIKEIITTLGQQGWTFTYIGIGHDIDQVSQKLSIGNKIGFGRNKEEIVRLFAKDRQSRTLYSQKISNKQNVSDNYFDDQDETEKA